MAGTMENVVVAGIDHEPTLLTIDHYHGPAYVSMLLSILFAKRIKELIVVLVKWLLFLDIVEYFLLHILVNWSKTGKDEKKS